MTSENKLVVASFRNINGVVTKTTYIDEKMLSKKNLIPMDTTSYYLYSKENDKVSKRSCQIGKSIKDAAMENKDNLKLLGVLAILDNQNYAYVVIDGVKHLIRTEDDMKLVSNYDELVVSFQDDFQNMQAKSKKKI